MNRTDFHNILVLGSGRSGTSVLTALYRESGLTFGESLLNATVANPRGYYEDRIVNTVNSLHIMKMLEGFYGSLSGAARQHPLLADERASWLAALPDAAHCDFSPSLRFMVQRLVARKPFCYKDPRFTFTFSAWRPFLPASTVYLVVFREPAKVVASILRNAKERYTPELLVTRDWAFSQWKAQYQRLLEYAGRDGQWMFIDYAELLDGSGLHRLEEFTGYPLVGEEIDRRISKHTDVEPQYETVLERECQELYRHLKARAASHDEIASVRAT